MESTGRFFFNPSASSCHGNMLFLGNSDSVFGGPRPLFNVDGTSKKRPFFSSPEDYFDEYFDEQLPEKKRRLTSEQANLLETSFEEENKLEPERKTELAKKLGLQPRQVAVWFQNRRARWKTKQIEKDYDLLKASYDSLLSDYDKGVKENEKLKSQVVSLTEKLHAKVAGATIPGPESDPLPVVTANASACGLNNVRVEDGLSSGSTTSAVVDEDSPQLLDSGDSFFQNDNYGGYTVPIDGIKSEEDDASDGGQNYFDEVFFPAGQQQQQERVEEPLVLADLDLREFFSTCYCTVQNL